MEPYYEKLSSQKWSNVTASYSLKHFHLEALRSFKDSFDGSWNLSIKFVIEFHVLLCLFCKGA